MQNGNTQTIIYPLKEKNTCLPCLSLIIYKRHLIVLKIRKKTIDFFKQSMTFTGFFFLNSHFLSHIIKFRNKLIFFLKKTIFSSNEKQITYLFIFEGLFFILEQKKSSERNFKIINICFGSVWQLVYFVERDFSTINKHH